MTVETFSCHFVSFSRTDKVTEHDLWKINKNIFTPDWSAQLTVKVTVETFSSHFVSLTRIDKDVEHVGRNLMKHFPNILICSIVLLNI